MYSLLIKQFARSRTVLLALVILITLGLFSIGTGRQFLSQKEVAIEKTIEHQKKHLITQSDLHQDDIGLLLYYLKFSFMKPLHPLAGISIGQSDLNSHIQNVSILNLEGQKYDTDLVNPMRLQVGNLDLGFIIIFLFPLLIIALTFNILSEEVEKGTWKMITIHGKSVFGFLIMKFSIRLVFVLAVLSVLMFLAKVVLGIPWDTDFFNLGSITYLYILFWFAVCFAMTMLRQSSNTNAIVLLTTWLLLVVFLPVLINKYVVSKYPVGEAFEMTIKQRDAYHKKWDTDKRATMEKFYAHYPQFESYGVQEEGFSWLWYYAMQQMGDDESLEEREQMYDKIRKREVLSKKIARYFPPLQLQLAMNEIASTSLTDQVQFLDATSEFHEKMRLHFYPKIFDNQSVDSIEWSTYEAEYFEAENGFDLWKGVLYTGILIFVLLALGVLAFLRKS